MRKINRIFALSSVALASTVFCATSCNHSGSNPSPADVTRDLNINDDWQFKMKGEQNYINVDLPYDYSIVQPFLNTSEAEVGYTQGGEATYLKKLTFPSLKNKRAILNFDGIYQDAYISINNKSVGEHHYGYSPFGVDITDYLVTDNKTENEIKIDTACILPNSRYYSGAGIYRDVTLSIVPSIHIARYGTYVTTPKIKYGNGQVSIDTTIENSSAKSSSVYLKHTIYDASDNVVASVESKAQSVKANSQFIFHDITEVDMPKLWSDTSPNLYYVNTEVCQNNKAIDSYWTRFGFRYYEFNSWGFVINGKSVKLNGASMHHDQGALGANAYTDAFYRQLMKLKSMGFNAIRTTHNTFSANFLKLCDELGFYVIEEGFDMWCDLKHGNTEDFSKYFEVAMKDDNHILNASKDKTWAEFAFKEMVNRDKNNPSTILWSIGNEIAAGNNMHYLEIAKNIIKWANDTDPSRPVTIGDNSRIISEETVNGKILHAVHDAGGVIGYNYPRDGYMEDCFATFGSCYASESASAISCRGEYRVKGGASAQQSTEDFHITSYDHAWTSTCHHKNIRHHLSKDFAAGSFTWTGFDYIGEPTPWNKYDPGSATTLPTAPNCSYFGIIDTAGFPKDVYYLYRAQYRNDGETVLNVVTGWNDNNMMLGTGDYAGMTPVSIYSNAPIVRLYLRDLVSGEETPVLETRNTTYITPAGHTYHLYDPKSLNEGLCKVVLHLEDTPEEGTSEGFPYYYGTHLYTRSYVKYDSTKALIAKAFDHEVTQPYIEITDTVGTKELYNPSTMAKINVDSVSKNELVADGHSLSYIELSTLDADSHFINNDKTHLNFKVEGEAVIAGVDNGDQTCSEKFQNTISPNKKEAGIKAYAGRALLILKSTHKAGNIKLTITDDSGSAVKTVNLTSIAI